MVIYSLIREDCAMKRIFILAALTAITLTACRQELDPEVNKPEPPAVFMATTESSATKTALSKNGDNYDVLWQNEDQITIMDAASHAGVYQTSSTTTQGSFSYVSGTAATTPDYMAWYPATLYDAGTPTLPATQEYTEGNIKNSPMYAESSTESLSFKNICGIIRLNVSTTQSGKKVRRIILSATQGMSGAITNAASLASDSYIAAVSGTEGITLDCGESGVAIGTEATAFHFAVPANSYTGLKITVITTDGRFQIRTLKSDKSIVVERSRIANITIPFNSLAAINPVQHWPFDGNADNVATGGVNATVYGATLTTDRFGNENCAYYFDGNDKMVAAGAAAFGTTSFTANVWACSTQTSGVGNLMRTDGGYYNGWLLRFNGGKIEIWEGRSNSVGYVSTTSYADGNWHMITFVRDTESRVGRLYVDGAYVGGYTMSGTINDVTNELRFGTYGDGEYYTGKMDDARLYDKALTAEEIEALYNTVYNIDINDYTDLSAGGTANSYIVPAQGNYKFRATVKGNGAASLAGVNKDTEVSSIASASLVWASFGTTTAPVVNEMIKKIGYQDGYLYFSTGDPYVEGNAVVAVKDAGGNILWSWHLWFESDNLETLKKTYPGGAVFMDRNLGALSNSFDAANVQDFGLLYQWGRKDPFHNVVRRGAGCVMDDAYLTTYLPAVLGQSEQGAGALGLGTYTVSYMTGFPYLARYGLYIDSSIRTNIWATDMTDNLWASDKTIFDPCPPGWKVPQKTDWDATFLSAFTGNTIQAETISTQSYWVGVDTDYGWFPSTGYHLTNAYYSQYDQLARGKGALEQNSGYHIRIWASDGILLRDNFGGTNNVYNYADFGTNTVPTVFRTNANSVRCVKE